ncbi:MAG: hypothetical protein HYX67_15190 [Candidatus Melainabacteria bacterium]|nr:hypothetical protein [Candidatus Melainabacteria bacterium]
MEEIHLEEEEFTWQSLQNFFIQFPDEKACLQAFPAVCRACNFINETDARSFVCAKCKTKTWRTAGTYFHGLKRLLPTFAWIWLVEDRATVSVKKFAEILAPSYSNAWDSKAKVKAVLEDELNKHNVFEVV